MTLFADREGQIRRRNRILGLLLLLWVLGAGTFWFWRFARGGLPADAEVTERRELRERAREAARQTWEIPPFDGREASDGQP